MRYKRIKLIDVVLPYIEDVDFILTWINFGDLPIDLILRKLSFMDEDFFIVLLV